VTALQTVDLRSQVTSTVREVHIREGQNVAKGDLLISLDARADEANIRKAEAQVAKDRADLATATRNLERQRELFAQKFISQSALDTSQNQVDTLKGQLAVDQAALEVHARRARLHRDPRALRRAHRNHPVRAGSLVQPGATARRSSPSRRSTRSRSPSRFPRRSSPACSRRCAPGPSRERATPQAGRETFKGRITFVDNAVDTATGTIRVKAEFANRGASSGRACT
jgi:multidrug efflux pump subunit AcrA (membrane-fusion protein)